MAFLAQTGYIVPYDYEIYHAGPGNKINTQLNNENNTLNQESNKHSLAGLCGDDLLTTIRFPQRSLSSQSLGKYWQLNQNNQETEHI